MAYTVNEDYSVSQTQSERQEKKKTESLMERLERQRKEKEEYINSL